MNELEMYKQSLKMMLRIIRPWKIRGDEYANGWNDCLKEMKKNEIRLFKHLEEPFTPLKRKGK
jgi:hypothetical protein